MPVQAGPLDGIIFAESRDDGELVGVDLIKAADQPQRQNCPSRIQKRATRKDRPASAALAAARKGAFQPLARGLKQLFQIGRLAAAAPAAAAAASLIARGLPPRSAGWPAIA
ncbi:hypothetical protein FHS62_001157 [Amphiplicatus metriothermophilus]|nr:hypothetical protein [Amphiplicatus metriothermophilus]MBB5518359.1 hypothetical protein [Amphiplicatus metriothermophilus]